MTLLSRMPAALAHAAALALVALCIGGIGSKSHTQVKAQAGQPVSAQGLPFVLVLHSFEIDTYEGTDDPRQYTSKLAVIRSDGDARMVETSVNHPAVIWPWAFYQVGYDTSKGSDSQWSVIECVRDPLYPAVRVILWALMAASLLLIVKTVPQGRHKWLWIAVGAIFVLFLWYTMDRVGVGARNLRPALRSPWFVPHIVVYMLAYATLTAVTVAAVVLWIRSQKRPVSAKEMSLCDTLAKTGWALLNAGMCMGALWAKEAWGDWWTWDPKETWALVTWAGYLAYFHLRGRVIRDPRTAFALLILDFMLLQMCWFGVNLLPGASMHTY